MKLHEAIEKLLKETGRPMSTHEIADAINRNRWYQKKAGSPIDSFQIHGRTRKYSSIFKRDGPIVSLIDHETNGRTNSNPEIVKLPKKGLNIVKARPLDSPYLEEKLLNDKNFKSAAIVDNLVPGHPGVYCIRITNNAKLPVPFNRLLSERVHKIVYIGIATKSLRHRLLLQELRAEGHGTFFRSIGAVLGFRHIRGSLIHKKNQWNYTFSCEDKSRIIKWINTNLLVSWVETNAGLTQSETTLVSKYTPLLNIAKNPLALPDLIRLRSECVNIATCP